jgi:hypothetical protein
MNRIGRQLLTYKEHDPGLKSFVILPAKIRISWHIINSTFILCTGTVARLRIRIHKDPYSIYLTLFYFIYFRKKKFFKKASNTYLPKLRNHPSYFFVDCAVMSLRISIHTTFKKSVSDPNLHINY